MFSNSAWSNNIPRFVYESVLYIEFSFLHPVSNYEIVCVLQVDGALPSVELLPDIKVTSLHGCTLRFTTIDLAPDVILNLSFNDTSDHLTRQRGVPILKDRWDRRQSMTSDMCNIVTQSSIARTGPQTTREEWCFLRGLLSNSEQQQRNSVLCPFCAKAIWRAAPAVNMKVFLRKFVEED
jgi:hypothetical protein